MASRDGAQLQQQQQLLSEIEESISINTSSPSLLVEDVPLQSDDGDAMVSSESLQRAGQFGIDPRFISLVSQLAPQSSWLVSSPTPTSSSAPPLLFAPSQPSGPALALPTIQASHQLPAFPSDAEEAFLEEQLDDLICLVEQKGIPLPPDDEDTTSSESGGTRDKLQSLRLPKSVFDSLVSNLKTSNRSALRQILLQHPMLTGLKSRAGGSTTAPASKNSSSNSRRKAQTKKSKSGKGSGDWSKSGSTAGDAGGSSGSTATGEWHGKAKSRRSDSAPSSFDFAALEKALDDEQQRFGVAAVVGKAIAEGSFNSYLIALSLLVSANQPSRQLPIFGLIAALFERKRLPEASNGRFAYLQSPYGLFLTTRGAVDDSEEALAAPQEPDKSDSSQKIEFFSSFGPFSSAAFAEKIRADASETEVREISTENAIVALLTVLSASSDNALGSEPAPAVAAATSSSSRPCENVGPLIAALPFAPEAITFLLVEYLLDKFISALCDQKEEEESFSSRTAAQPLFFRPGQSRTERNDMLVWSIGAILRVLSANLKAVTKTSTNFSSFGLGMTLDASDISFSMASSTKPFVLRLLQQVADCTGLAPQLVGEYEPRLDFALSSLESLQGRHFVKITAINAFINGMRIFRPQAEERIRLLNVLLRNAPTSADANLISDSSSPFLQHIGDDSAGFQIKSVFDRRFSYYELVLLQTLCLALAKTELTLGGHGQIYVNHSIGRAIVETSGSNIDSPMSMWESPESSGFKSELSSIAAKDNNNRIGKQSTQISSSKTTDPTSSLVAPIADIEFAPLEFSLLDRLFQDEILANCSTTTDMRSSLFSGELALLLRIQQSHLSFYSSIMRDTEVRVMEAKYNTRRCHPKIEVSDEFRLATNKGHKSWATVLTTKAILAGTGVHEWQVNIEKCQSGQAFVGVVTADASVETYVGGDRHGWGINGAKSLWHDKNKLKSEYGSRFSNQQKIIVRLDSDNLTLSISERGGDDWGVAFFNLPKVPLFPAVSVFHADDQISLQVSPSPDELNKPFASTARIIEAQAPAVLYAQVLLDRAGVLVKHAEEETVNPRRRELILSHPILSLLVPTLTSSLLSAKILQGATAYSSIQLLPYLTNISKRMASLRDTVFGAGSAHGSCVERVPSGDLLNILGNISGTWVMRSSAVVGSNIPEQEYIIALEYQPSAIDEDAGYGAKVIGSCFGGMSAMNLKGTQLGMRLKFLETWVMGGNSLVEGRVSLCGSFFCGSFKDAKTGKGGSIQGFRSAVGEGFGNSELDRCSNILFKSSLLCAMACGKFSSNLIIGLHSAFNVRLLPTEPNLDAAESSFRIEADDVNETPKPTSSEQPLTSVSWDRWLKSDLFSGGLPIDGKLNDFVKEELKFYITVLPLGQNDLKSDAEIIDLRHSSQGLLSQWLESTFPIFWHGQNQNSVIDESLGPPDESIAPRSGPGSPKSDGYFKKVDDYILQHIGQGAFSKLGGDEMISARKEVLPALIKHGGVLSLCFAEEMALASNRKTELDRPSTPLIDVWRATQRVIEQTVRLKQSSGQSFSSLRRLLCSKCKLLQAVQPSPLCLAVSEGFSMLSADSTTTDVWSSEAGKNVQQDCVKLLAEAVEFLVSPLRDVSTLHSKIFKMSFVAITRSAGFRSLNLLFNNKLEQTSTPHRVISQFNIVHLQPAALSYVVHALKALSEKAEMAVPDQGQASSIHQLQKAPVSASRSSYGHYMDGLFGVNPQLVDSLQSSFEQTYELITQMLSKCTMCERRDGQCIALTCWGIRVNPSDHVFLNRVGIFKVLQLVLENARATMASLASVTATSDINRQYEIFGPYAVEFSLNTIKRLSQLVLRVVNSIASQVAFSKDSSSISPTLAPRLQKMPSGPDTLSQSLFDMLYAELSNGLKSMLLQNANPGENTPPGKEVGQVDFLEGDRYIYRILRLLYIVSNSKVCQRSLCSAKWVSLLIAGIVATEAAVQRRILRLLRRILFHVNPSKLTAFVPSLFSSHDHIAFADSPLDDDDFKDLIDGENGKTSAEKVVSLLFQGISCLIPSDDTDHARLDVLQRLHIGGSIKSLSAESLVILRVLQGVPAWRDVLDSVICKTLDFGIDESEAQYQWTNSQKLLDVAAALAVNGGYIDRLRLGGIVTIRPFSLAGAAETFAHRLTAASQSCGMLVGQASTSNSAEVVVMERGMRLIKAPALLSTGDPNDRILQHTTNLAGSLPVRAMRVSTSDIMPAPDIPAIPEFVSIGIFEATIKIFTAFKMSWLQDSDDSSVTEGKHTSSDQDRDSENSHLQSLQLFVGVSSFRAAANGLQNWQLAEHFMVNHPKVLLEVVGIAERLSHSGGLNVIESMEERWVALWDAYNATKYESATSSSDGNRPSPSNSPRPSAGHDSRAQDSSSDDPRSSLIEAAVAASAFAGFGSPRLVDQATQQAAVAQMVDMGIPQEWCEVALRRCRYNVEMAINLCFENGESMSQMVAEDAILQAQAARDGGGIAGQVRRTLARFGDRIPPQFGFSRGGGSGVRSRADPELVAAVLRSLQEMGFPPSWCARAMEASANDLDASIGWIVSHSDQLRAEDEAENHADSPVLFNPLVCVSGSCEVKSDLTCSVLDRGGFPSIGCRGYGVSEGKWYFEATLHSAGCIQIGWADSAYEGSAADGKGVGDDEHSWAFDGWRMFLWHGQDISAEWGARWAAGDVVGCAVDMDKLVMSFYLNGLGTEIDMGTAFTGFQYSGGLYPAASFNARERIGFNFGGVKFANEPPAGYRAFFEHVNSVQEAKIQFLREIPSLQQPSRTSRTDTTSVEALPDGFEDEKGDQEMSWNKRFFAPDEQRAGGADRVPRAPSATFPQGIPHGNRKMLLEQLAEVSKDLSILYCRMSVMHILSAMSRIGPSTVANCLTHLMAKMQRPLGDSSNAAPTYMDAVMLVLRLCSVSSSRTKIYLMTMSTLPSTLAAPSNLGSILSTGGMPMLSEYRAAFCSMLLHCRASERSAIVGKMIEEIAFDTFQSVGRALHGEWRSEGGIAPVMYKDDNSGDSFVLQCPSLGLAVWMTTILLEQFAAEAAGQDVTFSSEAIAEIYESIDRLLKLWCFSLRAGNVLVKLCGIRILTVILQEIMPPTGRLSKVSSAGRIEILSGHVNLARLEKFTMHRLDKERASLPVSSEYLQALMELTSTVRFLRFGAEAEINAQRELELSVDFGESSYDWESICGRTCADDGWTTWSGSVSQHQIPQVVPSERRQNNQERHEIPPELMKGCRVCRPMPPLSTQPAPSPPSPPSDSDEVPPLASNESLPAPPSPVPKKLETADQFGSCVDVTSWPGDVPGSARKIQWDDGTTEVVRWNTSDGLFDVAHVKMDKDKIIKRFPNPLSRVAKYAAAGFGLPHSFGIILRTRRLPRKDGNFEGTTGCRIVGILEWPDFCAQVLVSGIAWDDGRLTLTEEKLMQGSEHASWGCRFGSSSWRSGTTFELNESQSIGDSSDPHGITMCGNFSYSVAVGNKNFKVSGDLTIQRQRLFTFDIKMKSPAIHISKDRLTAAKSGGSGGCVFASVGFCTGVHYWEFKIEFCDIGSIYIGVAEKPGAPGFPDSANCRNKMGVGMMNNRTSYRARPERQTIYGDQFLPGDTVGVMLDMNRGRLSFFLDGLKYGEHNITDLGEAFDNLLSSSKVRPRTLYPIVVMHRTSDRVAIRPRWISSIGTRACDELDEYCKASGLLSSWSIERKMSSSPLQTNLWAYREAWREWLRWRKGRYFRVRTRCKTMPIIVDRGPTACVKASLRLGLPKALFRGDRIVFTRSCGRQLEIKEEAVILGAFDGRLWYRFEASGGEGSSNAATAVEQATLSSGLVESSVLAWTLAPSDLDSFTLSRRGSAQDGLEIPDAVLDIELSLLPAFHGGLITVVNADGADMRDGLEIDTADLLVKIPEGTVLLAIERRINSSNVTRFRVVFGGFQGWISERKRIMGGDDEELLVETLGTQAMNDPNNVTLIQHLRDELAKLNADSNASFPDNLLKVNSPSFAAAVELWTLQVCNLGFAAETKGSGLLSSDFSLYPTAPTKDFGISKYIELSTTLDGEKQWHVEADMQLSELISRCALRDGVAPQNLAYSSMESTVGLLDTISTGPLTGIGKDRIMARAALMKTANQVFSCSLAHINVSLPEEKLRCQGAVVEDEIDIITTDVGTSPFPSQMGTNAVAVDGRCSGSDRRLGGGGMFRTNSILPPHSPALSRFGLSALANAVLAGASITATWNPPSTARRVRSLRRLLFVQTKTAFWDSVLDSTTTATALPQEELDDPREIKTLKINRAKATLNRLASIQSPIERLRVSVFGQLHKEIRTWPNSAFRRSYLGKGHGGQKRAFKVKFIAEGVDDYGGPYREVFEQIVDELQCDSLIVGRKASERCLLPLLIPCANRGAQIGSNQDKFLLSTAPSSPLSQELMQFFGKLTGTAVRQNLNLGLDFSALQWRALVRLPLTTAVLQTVDEAVCKFIAEIIRVGLDYEERFFLQGESRGHGLPEQVEDFLAHTPEEWGEYNFSTYLPDGTKVSLVPGGEDLPLTLGNWREFVGRLERCRLQECSVMFKALRDGLSAVLPLELLPLFTPIELEQLVSGTSTVDVALLRQCTEYEDVLPDSPLVSNFWQVLEEMTNEERTLFLRFVWARSRMPSSALDFPMNFKLQGVKREPNPDSFLPQAQTCFFSLALPNYSTIDVLRDKLLYAVKNSPNMDADVRIHSGEGWSDS